jgi:aminoglycoside 6'-N-acetyltransferase I
VSAPAPIALRAALGAGDPDWVALREALWPDSVGDADFREQALARGDFVRVAVGADGVALGFVEAAVRHDYVNGTDGPPVAFVEGLYVVPAARRRGIARRLVAAVAAWARARGLTELASDALLGNTASHAMHRALGFEETERVVYFRQSLAAVDAAAARGADSKP